MNVVTAGAFSSLMPFIHGGVLQTRIFMSESVEVSGPAAARAPAWLILIQMHLCKCPVVGRSGCSSSGGKSPRALICPSAFSLG